MELRTVTIFLLIVGIIELALTFTSDELRITLSNGSKLVGRYLRSYSGRPIKAFMGVPYAKPPLGPLRFKAPEPLEKWDGEYKALQDVPICIQRNPFIRSFKFFGTEDCLHLNVFVPHPIGEVLTNLPVMVMFHGGGFMCGSAFRMMYGPDHLLDKDVILITANHRLGALGFLSTGDANCPGNFGLKDQVQVLKWIRDNIKQFGGDPQSVTILGVSSGAASVTYLMESPLAEGLFSKAIAQSGTSLAPWALPAYEGVPQKRARQLADFFDCYKDNDWSATVECLRNVPAQNITGVLYDFYKFDFDPMVPFTPVIEPDLPGAFLTKHPDHPPTKKSLKIPFMTGLVADEGLIKSPAMLDTPGLFEEFVEKMDYALPYIFYYDHHDLSVQKSITKKLKKFYFDNNLTRDKVANFTNIFGDGFFTAAMDSYLRLKRADTKASNTYVYLLTNKISVSFTAQTGADPDVYYGITHVDELIYLFPQRDFIFPTTIPTKEEDLVRKAMVQLWTDFARTGNPTPDSSYLPKWNKLNEFPINYYRIGNMNFEGKPVFGNENGGMFEERAKFWRDLGAHVPASAHHKKDEF